MVKKTYIKCVGVSKGGKTSKIHTAVDELGRPRKIILTAGNVNDCDVACDLLDSFNLRGKTVIADRGYSTFKIKNFIKKRGATACVPPKSNFKNSWDYDKHRYKARNKIERFFARIKNCRRVATRYDRLDRFFLSFIYFALIIF